MKQFETKYGYFDRDGSYVIKTPLTPRPWVNVISNGLYGTVISQTGGGFSWYIHSNFNRINRWFQDLIKDDWGKYIFIRDKKNSDFWSAAYQPVRPEFTSYQVRHGFGYTRFETETRQVRCEYTIFVPMKHSAEVWQVKVKNLSQEKKELSLFTYLEWSLGDAPDNHREFFKTFIETEWENKTILARKRMWNLPNKRKEHFNRPWDYTAYHFSSIDPAGFETEKENFIGKYRDLRSPQALLDGKLSGSTGKWNDPIACLEVPVSLEPGEEKEVLFVLGLEKKKDDIVKVREHFLQKGIVDEELKKVKEHWEGLFSRLEIKTPDESMNLLVNKWLKYQAISCRIWGRAAYYQQSGAYGFRDQLQDSQVFLPLDPGETKKQIVLHAGHQFFDGSVFHWWHPIIEEGLRNNISDNLLWLPFLVFRYLNETADFAFLERRIAYFDKGNETLYRHCLKTFERVLSRMSRRFLPLIGGGDWNDGLNAVGTMGKGESIWLGFFLYHILDNWMRIFDRRKDAKSKAKYSKVMKKLSASLAKYGWDGKWYIAATKDSGEKIGSKTNKQGMIFLNTQLWAVISNAVPKSFQDIAMKSASEFLDKKNGSLLLFPAYSVPDEHIGYLSRYAPGLRENGGVYFHAATWSIWARSILKQNDYVYDLYKRMAPPLSGMKPDEYWTEPYVTPGNIDGVDSPNYGRGGWTWYTGSAAWFLTVLVNDLLGVQPDWKGLRIKPCIPSLWKEASVKRIFRGAVYNIRFINRGQAKVVEKIIANNTILEGDILPHKKGKTFNVEVHLK